MSSLFSSASPPPPPPVIIPPAPAPVPRMPDIGSSGAREAALDQVTSASGMSRDATNLTGRRRQTLGGGGASQSSAPVATGDNYSTQKMG